jgi:hypothetical protein
MRECKKYEDLIKKLIAGEIKKADEERLQKHINHCRDCKELMEAHYQIKAGEFDFSEPHDEEFAKIRQNVLRAIGNKEGESGIPWYRNLADRFSYVLSRPAFAAFFSLVLFLAGFFLHSWITRSQHSDRSDLIEQLKYTAQQNTELQQTESSPYIFSDVRIRNVNGGEVALGFNVSTHLQIVRQKNDPLVKEVLAQAVLNPAPLGNRLKAISYSEQIMDSKIKEALIMTMLNDDNLAVQIKTMTSLAAYPFDSQIQAAFLRILKESDQVQLRLMAIDYLTHNLSSEQPLQEVLENLNDAKDAGIKYKLYQQIKN